MREIRLIVTDMDGTFLNGYRTSHPDNYKAIAEAREAGILVCPCTGRCYEMAKSPIMLAGFDRLAILSNGAAIKDFKTGNLLMEQVIPAKKAEEVMRMVDDFRGSCRVYTNSTYVTFVKHPTKHAQESVYEKNRKTIRRFRENISMTRRLEDILILAEEGVQQVNVTIPDVERRRVFEQQVLKLGGLDTTASNPTDVEIMCEGVSKGNALIELARILGVERENVMAVGDNHNDVSMLRWAGIGVAVSNAVDAAKEAADHITGYGRENGLAQAIRTYALGRKSSGHSSHRNVR
ncbi:MAG: HAD family phosphatase [Clostridiales bacterium]|nr:HAD family phosphatase [Clostridiales bacterium]